MLNSIKKKWKQQQGTGFGGFFSTKNFRFFWYCCLNYCQEIAITIFLFLTAIACSAHCEYSSLFYTLKFPSIGTFFPSLVMTYCCLWDQFHWWSSWMLISDLWLSPLRTCFPLFHSKYSVCYVYFCFCIFDISSFVSNCLLSFLNAVYFDHLDFLFFGME